MFDQLHRQFYLVGGDGVNDEYLADVVRFDGELHKNVDHVFGQLQAAVAGRQPRTLLDKVPSEMIR